MGGDKDVLNASPFLEIFCKSSGKVRRFAVGTETQFALRLINRKLGSGVPLASYIEAVKDGEEPISFGLNSTLIDYGDGWKLETVIDEDFEKVYGVEPTLEQCRKENGVESTLEQCPKDNGLEPSEMFPMENAAESTLEQFPKENGVDSTLEQIPKENGTEPTLEQFHMENGSELTLAKVTNNIGVAAPLEQFHDVTVVPTLATPEPSSLVQQNSVSDDDKDRVVKDSTAVGPDRTDMFTTTTVFANREELIDWCQNVAKSIGAVVVIGKSDGAGNGRRRQRVFLTCERSGVNRPKKLNDTTEQIISNKRTGGRKKGSKKCECPFKLKGYQRDDGGWEVKVACGIHNHSLANNFTGHPYLDRLTREEQAMISELSKAGVKPREILNVLKGMNPNKQSTKQAIYNYRRKHNLSKMPKRFEEQIVEELGRT